ncbi:hypothetical protein BC831DRAFT_446586 [Entophlyctis helioformis]|nr:hypothetical protein BC831DRAFT_446586 [Entophlyctis helioformis]
MDGYDHVDADDDITDDETTVIRQLRRRASGQSQRSTASDSRSDRSFETAPSKANASDAAVPSSAAPATPASRSSSPPRSSSRASSLPPHARSQQPQQSQLPKPPVSSIEANSALPPSGPPAASAASAGSTRSSRSVSLGSGSMLMLESLFANTVMDDIESIHAMHGTASLGSMSLEQNYVLPAVPVADTASTGAANAPASAARLGLADDKRFRTSASRDSLRDSGSGRPVSVRTSRSQPSTSISATPSPQGPSQTSPMSWFSSSTSNGSSPPNSSIFNDIFGSENESGMVLAKPDGSCLDVASAKRNRDLHEIFQDMPVDELLVDDFACAWQKDVLLQGRIYVTDRSLMFIATLIWTYKAIIPYTDIVSLEKKTIAGIFPNAIEVSTKTNKYFFASFLSRDRTLDLMMRLWTGFPDYTMQAKSPSPDDANGTKPSVSRRSSRLSLISSALQLTGSGGSAASNGNGNGNGNGTNGDSETVPSILSSSPSHTADAGAGKQRAASSHGLLPADVSGSLVLSGSNSAGRSSSPQSPLWRNAPRSASDALADRGSLASAETTASSANLLLFPKSDSPTSRSLGLAEIASLDAASPEQAQSTLSGSLEMHHDSLDPHSSSSAYIIHQKHRVSLTKLDTPKPRRSAMARTTLGVALGNATLVTSGPPSPGATLDPSHPTKQAGLDKRRRHMTDLPESPVECACSPVHQRMTRLLDADIPLPVDVVWTLVYGHESAANGFVRRFWEGPCKHKNIKGCDWADKATVIPDPAGFTVNPQPVPYEALAPGHHRRIEYVVPLTNPLGPKETRCQIHDEIVSQTSNHVCIKSVSVTPDVPSGNCFQVVSRLCITFVALNVTHIRLSCEVEFLKSTWIRIAIERAAPDGIKTYHTSLVNELLRYIAATPGIAIDTLAADAPLPRHVSEGGPLSAAAVAEKTAAPTTSSAGPDAVLSTPATRDTEGGSAALGTRLTAGRDSDLTGPRVPSSSASAAPLRWTLLGRFHGLHFALSVALAILTVVNFYIIWNLSVEVDELRNQVTQLNRIVHDRQSVAISPAAVATPVWSSLAGEGLAKLGSATGFDATASETPSSRLLATVQTSADTLTLSPKAAAAAATTISEASGLESDPYDGHREL